MSDKPSALTPTVSTPADVQAAFSGGALLVNRTFLTLTPAGLRFAFAEQSSVEAPLAFRAAVVMSIQDAIALRNAMEKILSPIESQLEGAAAIILKAD